MQGAQIAAGGEVSSCWCQQSNGEKVADHADESSGWSTCSVKAAAADEAAADESPASGPISAERAGDPYTLGPMHGCTGNFYQTNYFSAGERNIGSFSSVADCVAAVKDQCPEYDIANVATSAFSEGPGSCWCQHS